MCHWIRPSELATKQSIWNASHSIGAGLISVICGFLLKHYGYSAWQLCFAVPAAIALVGAVALFFTLKDTPSSVGLPEIEDMNKDEKSEDKTSDASLADNMSGKSFKSFVNRMVFANPLIWILAVSNFCIYVVRFTILDWGATFLTQYKGMEISTAGTVVAASELVGGIAGMLLAGWFTDKFMKSRAHRTCFICTVGATLSFFLFWKSPAGMPWLSAIFICLSSFFIYGPQALLRHLRLPAGHQARLRHRKRHLGNIRVRQHSHLRCDIRLPRRAFRLGLRIPRLRDHRPRGSRRCGLYVEGPR